MNTQPLRAPARAAMAGFTLIEIMVVIVILGVLATLVVPNVIRSGDEAFATKAQTDVKSLADTVKTYYLQKRKLPDSLEDLTAPDDKGRVFLEDLPKDPWDNDYILLRGDRASEFEVVSRGPDGTENTEDDISSKKKES